MVIQRLFNILELNTEKEVFMAYIAPEDAQRPRAVYIRHKSLLLGI